MNGLIVGACIATVFVLGLVVVFYREVHEKKARISPGDTPRPLDTLTHRKHRYYRPGSQRNK